MSGESVERRLTTILAADVVGYSRLMAADEAGTLAQLKALRKELIDPKTAEYGGRVVKLMGDGTLMEFASVVDAVNFAVDMQRAIAQHNINVAQDRRIIYRIGINIGDIIVDGDDIYGDGVNIAARLEGLAEPGGICVAHNVFDQVKTKVEAGFEDVGDREVKNIPEPIRVYRVTLDGPTEVNKGENKTLSLPDKPSIAVLPFTNMSSDPEQEYFSDGITEDIITELSRFRELFVIARNSSFSYKGKAIKVQGIATDLGVRYVLEGSVRVAGDRIRITAQLIDAETGHHVWSERYNREITDLFALQDEIAQTVAGAVAGRLKLTAEDRAERKPIENLEAYDYALRGQSIIADTKENNLRARQAYEKAIELESTLTTAYVGLARSYIIESFNYWWDPNDRPLDHALEYAAKAVSLDNTDSKAQLILGSALISRAEYEEAKVHLERALELNPNDGDAFALMGVFLQATCKPQEAIDSYRKAMRLNPYYPAWYVLRLGSAYYDARQYEDALIPLKEAIERNPKFKQARLTLAATYAQLDRIEQARNQVERLLADHPDASIKQEGQWEFARDEWVEHWIGALRKAGLPE
ncbi:MAG: adenylate/guanylate cyclase domain-containing protein [Gammaproteobacteria bacterium]|nr:adenylate/guanylate cyclase domain-containing protein [Gammaproteobacteria bacterium]